MAFLTTIDVAPATRRLAVTTKRARIAVALTLAVGMLGAAAILHGIDRETAAAWFTGMGEALLFGTLGVLIGETAGAREAESRLAP